MSWLSWDRVSGVARRYFSTQGVRPVDSTTEQGSDYLDETECAQRHLVLEGSVHAEL